MAPAAEAQVELPSELRPKAAPIALTRAPPTYMDQIAVYVDEDALELKTSTADDLQRRLGNVPFETSMLLVALITARVHAARVDVDAQLRLARWLCGDGDFYKRIAKFVANHEHAVIFAEQNCMILQRLLIEAAVDAPIQQERTESHYETVVLALFGASSVAGMVEERARAAARTPEDFLAFFIQNGAYNSRRNPLGEITRAQELFERLAAEPGLQVAGCPIDSWAMEDYGFSVTEQMTLGFALSAIAHSFDDDPDADFKVHTPPENFDDLLLKLGFLDRRQEALNLLSATRAQLQAEFATAGRDAEHVAWETRPVMRHPFLRTQDDGLILLSPRAMQSWLSDGIYYRMLESAQKRSAQDGGKISNLFTSFAGGLLEAYAVEEMRSVLPGERPAGGGRVYGEQPYGRRGEKRTSDVAVDLGQDLVLVEVSNSRLRADTLILGDNPRIEADLDRMIIKKVKQLDGCINALIAGEAKIPGVDIRDVLRIWPVLVTAGEITQTDELWQFIADRGGTYLQQAKAEPLTLLDVEDYDQLCALVERGHALHELLAAKTRPAYRHLELAVWAENDPSAPKIERPPKIVENAFQRAMNRLEKSTDFTKGIQPEVTKAPDADDALGQASGRDG